MSTSLAVRIYKKYGDASIDVVRTEPYRLASDVWGIGFKTADTIAQAVGIPHDSPERIKAGPAVHALARPPTTVTATCPSRTSSPTRPRSSRSTRELVGPCLDELVGRGGRGPRGGPVGGRGAGRGETATVPAVYLVPFHRAEQSLASGLLALLRTGASGCRPSATSTGTRRWPGCTAAPARTSPPSRREAVRLALTEKVAVLTGGPGCGKSFTVRSIVELARAKKATVVLVAPTGRAAKRLAELTGHEASTVHRLLQLQPGGDPAFDRDNPLDADLVVVDESSMMDVILANKLVKAVPPGAHLLLVGDVDQLPSVGAGEVLRDLLAAEAIPRVRLTQIFRQAAAVRDRASTPTGSTPGSPRSSPASADFFWFTCDPAEEADAPGGGDRRS